MAFKVRITKPNIRIARRQVRDAVSSGRETMGLLIAERLKAEILKRIPNRDGWFKVYRESLEIVSQPPSTVLIVGRTDTSLSRLPADRTAIFVEGEDAVGSVMKQYNPWPVDMLPAIRGGARVDLRAAPASESELNKLRTKLLPLLGEIKTKLRGVGFTMLADAIPVFNGKVYFDFNFMANRLEYGIGPFRKAPHWKPAKTLIEAQAGRIVNEIADAVERAMRAHL